MAVTFPNHSERNFIAAHFAVGDRCLQSFANLRRSGQFVAFLLELQTRFDLRSVRHGKAPLPNPGCGGGLIDFVRRANGSGAGNEQNHQAGNEGNLAHIHLYELTAPAVVTGIAEQARGCVHCLLQLAYL